MTNIDFPAITEAEIPTHPAPDDVVIVWSRYEALACDAPATRIPWRGGGGWRRGRRDLILTRALLAVRNGTTKRAPLRSSVAYYFHIRVFRALNTAT